MKTINKNNSTKEIQQFNLSHLTTGRANIINKGWQDIKIEDSFFNESINEIVNLIGGREATKQAIKFSLRNTPIHQWFANRIIFDGKNWSYIAGQDYPSEIKEIRRQLTTKF